MNDALPSIAAPAALDLPAPKLSGANECVTVSQDGVSWTIRPELVAQLLPVVGRVMNGSRIRENLTGAATGDELQIVKQGPHRTVYRVSLPAGVFYLKHFRNSGLKALLLSALRPCKAEREWNSAVAIARLGLPTFEPVALGRLYRNGIVRDSFLVSREIEQALPLDEFAVEQFLEVAPNAARQSALRQNLAVALAKLTAELHAAGVEHADFHAANVLVRMNPQDRPELWLIDLHRVHFRGPLPAAARQRNLTMLHQFFVGKSTRADRLRFYCAYQRECRRLQPAAGSNGRPAGHDAPDRTEMIRLEETLATAALRGWERADRAWRRGNRHVRKLRGAFGAARSLASLNPDWARSICDDPEQWFRTSVVTWHKRSVRCRVAEVELASPPAPGLTHAVWKCVEPRRDWRRLLAGVRFSTVRKAWETGHALRRRGIDTPCPILFIEQREGSLCRNYLLTERIVGAVNAVEFFSERWPGLTPAERRAWLDARLGRLALQVRRLHDSQFDHRDLKFPNLLVSSDPRDPRVWLLDLDGVRRWRRLPAGRAAQNLARLCASALAHRAFGQTDHLRFLKHYLGAQFAGGWKGWWRRIAPLASRKLALNRRRGRLVA